MARCRCWLSWFERLSEANTLIKIEWKEVLVEYSIPHGFQKLNLLKSDSAIWRIPRPPMLLELSCVISINRTLFAISAKCIDKVPFQTSKWACKNFHIWINRWNTNFNNNTEVAIKQEPDDKTREAFDLHKWFITPFKCKECKFWLALQGNFVRWH